MPRGYPAGGARKPVEHKQYWFKPAGEPTPDTDTTRACVWCGEQYPIVQYGRRRVCSDNCRKARNKEAVLQAKYGIGLVEYRAMWDRQKGRCALCRRQSKLSLAVEHSHITGTVRGLCCMTCNRDIIGPLDGKPERLQEAIQFLTFILQDLEAHLYQPRLSALLPMEAERPKVVRLPKIHT